MGKVLEPATPAALHVRSLTPLSSCNSRTQVTLVLPRSAGLKIFYSRRPAAGISPHSPFFHRRGTPRGIVCEQREQEVIVSVGAVNEATWKELVLDCDIPVLVDFWAPWCGPCRMIAPLVDELAKLYAGRVRCLKLNTDESPNKATEYGIRSIPTVLIFKKGEKKDAIVGAVPKATIVATVEKYLDK